MSNQVTAEQIENQIAADIRACETLLTLMDQEREALKGRDADKLAEIIESKVAPLNHLEASAVQRCRWAEVSSLEQASEAWQKLLSSLNRETLQRDWERLKELTDRCKKANEINGKLLVRNQQVFGRLVDLMRGQTSAPPLYNTYGAKTGGQGSHKIGEA